MKLRRPMSFVLPHGTAPLAQCLRSTDCENAAEGFPLPVGGDQAAFCNASFYYPCFVVTPKVAVCLEFQGELVRPEVWDRRVRSAVAVDYPVHDV